MESCVIFSAWLLPIHDDNELIAEEESLTVGPACRRRRGSEVLRHGARHAHHRQRVRVRSSNEKELGGGIPCDATSAIHVGRVDEALLDKILEN